MKPEIVKKGVELAQKELEEKQIEKVKDIVKATLTKIKDIDQDVDDLKKRIKDLEEKKKILRLDIDDLKEGRLDRIEERQSKDVETKKVSVIIVEKEVHHHHYDRWYEPYRITYVPYYPAAPVVTPLTPLPFYGTTTHNNNNFMKLCGTAEDLGTPMVGLAFSASSGGACNASFTTNSSMVKNNVVGTYCLGDKTVHLR